MYKVNLVKKKQKSTFVNYMLNKCYKKNGDFRALIEGESGSGKSWASLRLGEICDKTFTVKDNVHFNVKEFVKFIMEKPPIGTPILLDEAGVALNNLQFWSKENIAFDELMQTIRSRNYIIFITAPDSQDIDKKVKRKFHAVFQMAGVNYKEKFSRVKVKMTGKNTFRGNSGNNGRFFRRINKDTKAIQTLSYLRVKKPSQWLIDEYEKKKWNYQERLNEKALKTLDQVI